MSVEQRVHELEERVDLLESILTDHAGASGRDHYDEHVITRLADAAESVTTRRLRRWYRDAGIRNRNKIRARIKDLEAAGLVENVGKTHWRYVGPRQSDLSGVAR